MRFLEFYGSDMISLQLGFIYGVAVGFELIDDEDEDIAWAFILDLAILRIVLSKFKE